MFWLQLIKLLIMLLLCDDFIYIITLIQELGSTKTYEQISTDDRSIVNTHSIDITAKKGKRKVQGVPQSQTTALSRHQEKEETDKTEQAQIEQT